ncbi:hypothetical protein [Vibrio crassostreae]|uniref:hypothetical protein n=1 Tax=Vibrio crassostreae TaxID=246167 RepID=UPI001B315173|nr:hypothetical protein [Vibrio crassostreae]
MKIHKVAIALSFLIATNAIAEDAVTFKLGGWSKHLTDMKENTKEHFGGYNEKQQGFGIERVFDAGNNTSWSAGISYMKDSYSEPAFTIGGSWKKRYANLYGSDFFVDLGVVGGVQSRSYIKTRDFFYESTERMTMPFVAPMLNVGYKQAYANFIVYPHITKENDELVWNKPVIFWQFAYDFKI